MAQIEVQRSLLDDIRDFIAENWKKDGGSTSVCERCGTDRWMIYPEPTTHLYLAVGDERGPPAAPQPMVAFLPASCTKCGNLRLIDARTFEKWRRTREYPTTASSR
jgi:hypothetical protein